MNLRIISAGAGSGKTFRLTKELVALLQSRVRPTGVIATTFTNKAASELQERVRVKLLEEGQFETADAISDALIGTVHSLGVKLLRRFSFEMGVSPRVDIVADEDHQLFFNQSLSTVLTEQRVNAIENLISRFNLGNEYYDWRSELRKLIEAARVNGFSSQQIQASRDRSWETFEAFLQPVSQLPSPEWDQLLADKIKDTLARLPVPGDTTKVTREAMNQLQSLLWEWERNGQWAWHHWARVGKIRLGAKSREAAEDLREFAQSHEQHPQFRKDWKTYLFHLFDLAVEAVEEYSRYKKERGLIDYTDMEVLVSRLLDRPEVQAVLTRELDLLLVDEFQDTSPIQLDIFLKLSGLVKKAIWVGDPKQSIYGFRGAEPRLMQAIIDSVGGVKPEDIQRKSWRSRAEIVYLTNAIFTRAFPQFPEEQIALEPVRLPEGEPVEATSSLLHWYVDFDGEGRTPGKAWSDRALTEILARQLEEGLWIKPKTEKHWRLARPGDVAILCRTNTNALRMARALNEAGLKASLSRAGLINTAEAKLLLACLRYLLSEADVLAVAELLLLASGRVIDDIVEDRLDFLEQVEAGIASPWGLSDPFIRKISDLRESIADLSAFEIVNLVLDELDLRRIASRMGNTTQRLANLEEFRKLSLQYEESCNRLHTAASLGGFLLWLGSLTRREQDQQGSGDDQDAVQVFTYHKSKGLEWPVVICHDLDSRLRTDIWGMTVIPETEQIDLANVLANRWIRYWVNPYGRQVKNTPIDVRLEESQLMEDSRQQALAEEARLLYVGITRARDHVVIPQAPNRPTAWLDRVWQQGEGGISTLDKQSPVSPFQWKEKELSKLTRWEFFGPDIGIREAETETVNQLAPPPGRQPGRLLEMKPGDFTAGHDFHAGEPKVWVYGPPLLSDPTEAVQAVGKAACAFIAADHPSYAREARLEMADRLLSNFKVKEELEPKTLLEAADKWNQFLAGEFQPYAELRKIRLHFWTRESLYRDVLDLALECKPHWLLIQHDGFWGNRKQSEDWARKKSPTCHLMAKAWQNRAAGKGVRTFVHLPLSCMLIELTTDALGKQQTLDL